MTYEQSPPHKTTVDVASKIMEYVTHVVMRDKYAHRFELLHEVSIPSGTPRIGQYRVVMYYKEGNEMTRQRAHLYDLQMMLDLKDEWKHRVETTTLNQMAKLIGNERD